MKRLWICLLAFALLTGCGDSGDIAVTTVYETDDPPRTALTTEWETYDPSVETVWCILSYEGEGESLEYGAPYWLDVREADGSWTQVPLAENAGWDAMLYTLPSGEKQAFPCILSLFDYDFSGGGTFRVIKEIGEYTAAAEFTLTKGAVISAETPYGFGPMEEVPEYGDPAELSAGGAVVFTEAGTENADAAEIFLEKVSLGIPCQLRTLQNYYESWPMLIDVIYDGRGFLWRMRTGGEITEKRFSYIVTDGTDVYLSNGADWESTEQYDSEKAFLLPSGSGSFLVPAAEAMTDDRLAENTARYRIWSGDGMRAASLTEDPAEFSVIRCDPESGTWSRSWTIRELDPVINIRHVPLSNALNAFSKRCVDLFGAIVALILFSPVMAVVSVIIKATSPGPLIFRQERIGLQNKPFPMYKFRSMVVQDAASEKAKWTVQNDPRVTPIGKFIRKTSIDELPQLFNVLKGDMSLVGPRPERPQFVEKFREEIPRYMVKHQVRPGLTGWAQVNGYRGDTSIRKRIEHDLYYIENWTLGFDFKILFLTFFKGFVNKNAY